MWHQNPRLIAVLACVASIVCAAPALAQGQAGISGTARDNTGGAIPGVTVVAASPALIEQRRVVATDGAGNYSIVSLPAGTYTVTFTLQGFNTVVREGVVLQGAFVASIDADLAVGTLSETLTVTGASPTVDVVSTRQQTVLSAERVHILPGSTSVITAMQYVPGVQGNSTQATGAILHGGDGLDSQPHIDGIKSGMQLGARNTFQGGIGLVTDESAISEIVFDTSGQGAEYAHSGVRTNMIPKTGGNRFATLIYANGTRANFLSNNISPANHALGIRFAPQAWTWNVNRSLGGPIQQDKLWFFTSLVQNKSKNYILNSFFDPNDPTTPKDVGKICGRSTTPAAASSRCASRTSSPRATS